MPDGTLLCIGPKHGSGNERAVAWRVLPCSGSVSEQFLACNGALDASSHDLDGGVRSAAVAHVFLGEKSDFAARWGCCREMSFLP